MNENHSLGEWFKRSLMAMMKGKNSLCYNRECGLPTAQEKQREVIQNE